MTVLFSMNIGLVVEILFCSVFCFFFFLIVANSSFL